jgi:hypothetical protein
MTNCEKVVKPRNTEGANGAVDVGELRVGGNMLNAAAFDPRVCLTSTKNEKHRSRRNAVNVSMRLDVFRKQPEVFFNILYS